MTFCNILATGIPKRLSDLAYGESLSARHGHYSVTIWKSGCFEYHFDRLPMEDSAERATLASFFS